MEVGKAGTSSGLIATTAFQGLATSEAAALGVVGLPILIVDHPLGGERPEFIAKKAQQAFEQLRGLGGRR